MAEYPSLTLTLAGIEMIAESQATGTKLIITNAKIGDGTLADGADIEAMTDIIASKLVAPLSNYENLGNGELHVTFAISNATVESGFFAREIGIFAMLEDGTEKLYAYANAGLKCDWIPSKSTPIDSQVVDARLVIGNAENVTVMVTDDAFALARDFLAHEIAGDAHENRFNAHNTSTSAHTDIRKKIQTVQQNASLFMLPVKRNTTYAVGDCASATGLPSWAYLECITAGTTAETEPSFGGGRVADGTVVWRIKDVRCPYSLGEFVFKMNEPKDYEYLLLCDGSTISEDNYPELVAVLGGTQLPNLIDRFLQGSATAGTYKEAGLPNITGNFVGYDQNNDSNRDWTGAFQMDSLGGSRLSGTGPAYDYEKRTSFNAARCSTVYGSSTTVQPPALTMLPIIKY